MMLCYLVELTVRQWWPNGGRNGTAKPLLAAQSASGYSDHLAPTFHSRLPDQLVCVVSF